MARSPTAAPPRSKNTLFCPECGHESPSDGDWQVRRATSDAELACPTCGAAVTRRSRRPQRADAAPAGAASDWGLATHPLRLAVGLLQRVSGTSAWLSASRPQ